MLIPKTTEEKLTLFKERFDDAKGGNSIEHELFQKRLDQYNGTHELTTPKGGEAKKATIVRPVTDELIEGQITSSYPLPKIEPRRQSLKGRERARKIEAMLTAEHKRMSYQYIHDEDERSTKIFGGNIQQVDWDNTKYTHDHVGEVCVRNINPMQFEPQEGITDIHELDYYFFTEEDTAERIFEKYGIPHELLTQKDNEKLEHHFCQYVNNDGKVGLFSWIDDVAIQDIEDYQARRNEVCTKCLKPKPDDVSNDYECPCGSKEFEKQAKTHEEIYIPLKVYNPATQKDIEVFADIKNPIKIPFYQPDKLPIVLRKNVSVPSKLFGKSDCDKIKDLQEAHNKASTLINEKMHKGGSVVTMDEDTDFIASDDQLRILRFKNAQSQMAFGIHNLQPDIGNDIVMRDNYYREMQSALGQNDTWQGKEDRTATSGVAKQAQISRTAGILDSKFSMRNIAAAERYHIVFQFMLAYADEPRHYSMPDDNGDVQEVTFNRYDFLNVDVYKEPDGKDETGKDIFKERYDFYWDDQFIFDVDVSATLASNREAMWQETRMNFGQGVFGTPQEPMSQILFWEEMEALSYPNASRILKKVKNYAAIQMQMQQLQEQNMALQQRLQQQQQGFSQYIEQLKAMGKDKVDEINKAFDEQRKNNKPDAGIINSEKGGKPQ